MSKRPVRGYRVRYQRQRESSAALPLLIVPAALIGVVVAVAFTLIYVIVIRGPDTHANLWNEARDYQRTELAYVIPATLPPPPPSSTEEISFAQNVLPIFEAKCVACHGLMGFSAKGVSLTSYEALMSTQTATPLVIPGDPESSLLPQVLRREVLYMPPSGRLPEEKIQLIEQWIAQGAANN